MKVRSNTYASRRRALQAELDRLTAYLRQNPHPADEQDVLRRISEITAQLYL